MLLNGGQLRQIFSQQCPFDENGQLIAQEQRSTVLAANVNLPMEIQGRAFAMAAALEEQSPLIVQISYNSCLTLGSSESKIPPITGVSRSYEESALVAGALFATETMDHYCDIYGAELVAIALDHFNVPKLGAVSESANSYFRRVARARLDDAIEVMRPVFGDAVIPTADAMASYISYLASPEYRRFRHDFLQVVAWAQPAWAMIDTEKLPPVLDFAVTKDIVTAVRFDLGNQDVILEAEYGATGHSGDELEYCELPGQELHQFAREVALFCQYTGADGIAYPIGMKHAAKANERYQPDLLRLETVQREILVTTGRYVPFAQHGGTGAAEIAWGLVGKNNVNTNFLVAGMNALLDFCELNSTGIRAGQKSSCGARAYNAAIHAVAEAVIQKLKDCRSFGLGSKLRQFSCKSC